MKFDYFSFRRLLLCALTLVLTAVVIRLFLRRTLRTAKLKRWWRLLSDCFHEHQLLKVPQFDPSSNENHLYRRLSLYLNSLPSLEDSHLTNLFSGPATSKNPTRISLSLDPNQSLDDLFLGSRLRWTHLVSPQRAFVLRIRKRDKRRVLRPYLQHIHTVSDEIERSASGDVRLFTNSPGGGGDESCWKSVPFTHPATIDTIAMDADVKSKVVSDLETFLKSKQYYHRLGRAWRRSYLLYGPSGTGKSSFVAAMAKLLGYDIYDVDLSTVRSDSDLKLLLLRTTSRSVILIEAFDRYIAAASGNSGSAVSVSGLLNFMDGVVNSCCDERVMVFTVTAKDGIDPALLRPGRVDVHIQFPMCDFSNFKNMASNYLGINDHKLFPMVEEMIQSGARMSPAEIGELLMVNRSSPSRALKSVINALQKTTSGGDGRAAPRISGPRRSEPLTLEAGRESADSSDSAMVGCKDGVKEFRKLYGLLTRKTSKRSQSFDLDA